MIAEYNKTVKSYQGSSTGARARGRGRQVHKKNPNRLKNIKLGDRIGSALR